MVAEGTLFGLNGKGNKNDKGKGDVLGKEEPLRIEPKRTVKLEPKKPTQASPKETVEEKKETVVPTKLAETRIEMPLKKTKEEKSPLFDFLFILSIVFMAVTVGLLLLPVLNIPVPSFITSLISK